MKKDEFVKIVSTDESYRFGFIQEVTERGYILVINLYDEGESKIAYDEEHNSIYGEDTPDYVALLSDIEKRIVPLLADRKSTNEIAAEMSLTTSTVRAHLRMMRIKTQMEDRTQLVALCQGLVKALKQAEEE